VSKVGRREYCRIVSVDNGVNWYSLGGIQLDANIVELFLEELHFQLLVLVQNNLPLIRRII
jgi:hypothetical protein